MLITSSNNAQVKRCRSLLRRKERDKTGLYLVEGTHLVEEAIRVGADVEMIIFCRSLLRTRASHIIDEVERCRGVPLMEVTEQVFASISKDHAYQGIAAVIRQRWESLSDIKASGELCWIAIDSVQYPSNLGTMLRASDAVGGAGVILIGNSTDPYCQDAVQASAGAILSQRVVRTNFYDFSDWARRNGYMIIGTSPNGSVDYRMVTYRSPQVLLMGNERRGLTEEQQSLCDTMVKIPMLGRMDSHNVAVATSIIMYEILSQREGIYGVGKR